MLHIFKILIITIIFFCAILAGCRKQTGIPCSGKFFRIGNHAYCAYRAHSTWNDAFDKCKATGGHLVVIDNQSEMNAIKEILCSQWGFSGNLWIGLNDIEREGLWQWASGELPTYGNWRSGQPDNKKGDSKDGEDCVEWYSDNGTWNDRSCNHKRGYLCKSLPQLEKEFRCTGTYFSIGNNKYCAYKTMLDWISAKKACEVNGGQLAAITSPDENKTIHENIGSPWEYNGNLWIGCSDQEKEGNFQWVNNRVVQFGNWCPGEPNDAGKEGEDCSYLRPSNGCWNDARCNGRAGFICESD
ncbi:MAG: hypothetical protein GY754_14925 [bacterium]|nr:hypothetical protein [bacterium]